MILKPTRTLVSFDWAMKSILRDKANFDVLEGFLTTLLNQEITVISCWKVKPMPNSSMISSIELIC